jgi:hypothetical protein
MIQGRYLSVPSTVDSGEERRRRRRAPKRGKVGGTRGGVIRHHLESFP